MPAAWEQRARLLQDTTDTTVVAFAALQDPAAQGVSGDVAWNQALQRGFLRFRGLPENNPAQEQYQLWIFDAGRPDGSEFPVDGGVFDISSMTRDPATGDLVVPINAKLPVVQPAAFAVTIERAGGVVVTKRERLLLLAQKP
jgi:anti-sigma-K factor RskA